MKALKGHNLSMNSVLSSLTKTRLPIRKYKLDLNQKNLNESLFKKSKANILEFTVRRIDQPDPIEQEEDEEQQEERQEEEPEPEVTDETLNRLARVIKSSNKVHILKIDCPQCPKITTQGLKYLSESIRGLTSLKNLSLNFKLCEKISGTGLSHLFQTLKTLTSLQNLTLLFYEKKKTKAGDWELSILGLALKGLPSLRKIHLEFSSFRKITNLGIRSLSKSLSNLPFLQALNLQFEGPDFDYWWMEIDSAGIQVLSQNLKKLISLQSLTLNFSNCKKVCDKGLQCLAQTLITLSSLQKIDLDFDYCEEITQGGIGAIYQSLEKLVSLQNLKLSFSRHTDAGIENFGRTLKPLSSSLKNLHHDFTGSDDVTDIGMQNLGEALKSCFLLESINFSFPFGKNISNIDQFSQAFAQLPLLKHINLNFLCCEGISDEGINSLSQDLAKLTLLQSLTLDFEYCSKITDKGIRYLSETLHSSLTKISLDFEGCDSITTVGVSKLSQALSQLTLLQNLHLGFGRCYQIQRGINALSRTLKNLTQLQSFSMKCEILEDDELSRLSGGLKDLVSVREIDITANLYDANDECIENFAQSLRSLPALQSICFCFSTCEEQRNELRNSICQALKRLPCLRILCVELKDRD